jgi:hypothetical protein
VDYFEFRRSFESSLSKLTLPSDCILQEPNWEILAPPLSWSVEAVLRFSDQKHIRVRERYDKFAKLEMSRKIQWSYHYGPTEVTDEDGDAIRGNANDPLDIRVDTCSGLHLHYQTREPHLDQKQISGLVLESIDAFKFVRGVLRHRKTGQPFTKIFGFKIK